MQKVQFWPSVALMNLDADSYYCVQCEMRRRLILYTFPAVFSKK